MILAKKLGIAAVGIAIGLAGVGLPSAAQALQFNLSYSVSGITASGNLITNNTPDGSGYYTITGINGSRNGVSISTVLAAGSSTTSSGSVNDNLFNPIPNPLYNDYFNSNGFAYQLANGETIHLNYRGSSIFEENITSLSLAPTSSFTASAGAPEPSDIGGLAILLGMGGLMVRKFKSSQKPTTFIAETRKETLVS